jgi:hypothetical protein
MGAEPKRLRIFVFGVWGFAPNSKPGPQGIFVEADSPVRLRRQPDAPISE